MCKVHLHKGLVKVDAGGGVEDDEDAVALVFASGSFKVTLEREITSVLIIFNLFTFFYCSLKRSLPLFYENPPAFTHSTRIPTLNDHFLNKKGRKDSFLA